MIAPEHRVDGAQLDGRVDVAAGRCMTDVAVLNVDGIAVLVEDLAVRQGVTSPS